MSSYISTLLVALLPLTAFALPNPVAASVNSTVVSSICSKDIVYLQLAAPVLASTASKFCTTYIRPTITATGATTVTQTTTATTTQTVYTATVIQKRAPTIDLSALAPSSLLSSACSCLLVTALPAPTTVYTSTQTVTTTATATKTQKAILTCKAAAFTSPIQNGDFSQGSANWTVVSTADPSCGNIPQGYCFNDYYSGFSTYGPQTTTLSQTLVTCTGTTYLMSITFKSTFCAGIARADAAFTFNIDGQVIIDGGNQACGEGVYPYLGDGPFHTVNATFTAQSNSPVFSVYNTWPGDAGDFDTQSVVITPVQQ